MIILQKRYERRLVQRPGRKRTPDLCAISKHGNISDGLCVSAFMLNADSTGKLREHIAADEHFVYFYIFLGTVQSRSPGAKND